MDERTTFWLSPGRWPRDTADFVFLARAVDHIGKVLFEDVWVGTEPSVSDQDLSWAGTKGHFPLPQRLAKPWQKRLIHNFLLLTGRSSASALLHPAHTGAHGPLRCQTKLGVKVLLLLGG